MATEVSNESVNVEADALAVTLNNGYLRIYSGTRPATANTALAGNTLLAELRFGATAFGAAVNGVLTANALTADSSADNTGTASFYRALRSDGTTVAWQGDVGTSGASLNLSSVSIVAGGTVNVTSLTYTVPKS